MLLFGRDGVSGQEVQCRAERFGHAERVERLREIKPFDDGDFRIGQYIGSCRCGSEGAPSGGAKAFVHIVQSALLALLPDIAIKPNAYSSTAFRVLCPVVNWNA